MTIALARVVVRTLMQSRRTSKSEKEALEFINECLIKYEKSLDTTLELCEDIGNKYIFHADRKPCAYDTGYNAAIRDALEIIKKLR